METRAAKRQEIESEWRDAWTGDEAAEEKEGKKQHLSTNSREEEKSGESRNLIGTANS